MHKLSENLHALRRRDEDPTSKSTYTLFVYGDRIVLHEGSNPPAVWTWTFFGLSQREERLEHLKACIRDLEYALNEYGLEIYYRFIQSYSPQGKPQHHVDDALNEVIANMRVFTTLSHKPALALASVGSVSRVVVRVAKISQETAAIAADRRARAAGLS